MNAGHAIQELLSAMESSVLLERLFFASLELAVLAPLVAAAAVLLQKRSPRLVALLWLLAIIKPLASLAVGFAIVAHTWVTLPDVRPLRREAPSTTAFRELRARQAEDEGRALKMQHRWVGYDRISAHLKRAVIVAEDSAFWQHEGLDFDEIRASMAEAKARGD